jgi:hypothetical protein
MDIVVSFSRKRKNFGKHCYFSDKPAEIIADIQPEHSIKEEYTFGHPPSLPLSPSCTHSSIYKIMTKKKICRKKSNKSGNSVCAAHVRALGEHRQVYQPLTSCFPSRGRMAKGYPSLPPLLSRPLPFSSSLL